MLYSVPWWFGQTYPIYSTDFYAGMTDAVNDPVTNKWIHYTILYNTFILMNLFNQFNCRKLGWRDFNIFDNFFNNIYFFIIVGGEFAAQYFIVQIGGAPFRTESLSMVQWITCLLFGVGALIVGALAKFIPEAHSPKFAFNLNE